MGARAGSQPSSVSSADGTPIAYWTTGEGPPLVVVHGTPADHTRWAPLLPHLEPHFTVHALDRRGRGASGDAAHYAIEREYEDVAAVVEAAANRAGERVRLYGHSHGGIVAFGAATLTGHLGRLLLYEGWPLPDPEAYALPGDLGARIDTLVQEGDGDAAVELLFRELEDMSDDDMRALKAAPSWPARVAAAGTVTREIAGEVGTRFDADAARRITAPVLLVVGEKSVDPSKDGVDAVASSLLDARITVLEGQEHAADALEPELFAARVLPFLLEQS